MIVEAKLSNTDFTTYATAGEHTMTLDEPQDIGGSDVGATPTQHLVAALASCTIITLKMYLNRKQWEIESIDSIVDYKYDISNKRMIFKVQVNVKGSLDDTQLNRLDKIARACPVHKMLHEGNRIEVEIIQS